MILLSCLAGALLGHVSVNLAELASGRRFNGSIKFLAALAGSIAAGFFYQLQRA